MKKMCIILIAVGLVLYVVGAAMMHYCNLSINGIPVGVIPMILAVVSCTIGTAFPIMDALNESIEQEREYRAKVDKLYKKMTEEEEGEGYDKQIAELKEKYTEAETEPPKGE